MKKREIIVTTIIIVILCCLTTGIVYNALTGSNLFARKLEIFKRKEQISQITNLDKCSNQSAINLDKTADPNLIKFNSYQKICNSYFGNSEMTFTNMPKDSVVAKQMATDMAQKLKEFKKYGITPIVIIEPVTDWGLIDFEEFKSGFYNTFISDYFSELKKDGVSESEMGIWVPFPEANLPNWNHANATPEDFAAIVNIYLKILRTYFPNTKGSILLNSATYATDDFDWSSGEYISLRDYVSGINKDYIDSFGIQGFPWAPQAESTASTIYDAKEFLNSDITLEAANILGVKKIWINTGTFAKKYTLDPTHQIEVQPEIRLDILNSILSQALDIKKHGFDVTINIFAEDKSQTAEATDWSYKNGHESVFVNFASKANQEGISLSLFDQ